MSIVTHPGHCHLDDLFACAIALTKYPGPIYRRNPTPEDLMNPGCIVLDVGGVYDPRMQNFDHHQSGDLDCALKLFLRSAYPWTNDLVTHEIFKWVEAIDILDRKGPDLLGLGMSLAYLPNLMKLRLDFEKSSEVSSELEYQLSLIGEYAISTFKEYALLVPTFQKSTTIVEIDGLKCAILENLEMPSEHWQGWVRAVHHPDLLVRKDSRSIGWSVYRPSNSTQWDARLIKSITPIFVHNNGFMTVVLKENVDIAVREGKIIIS